MTQQVLAAWEIGTISRFLVMNFVFDGTDYCHRIPVFCGWNRSAKIRHVANGREFRNISNNMSWITHIKGSTGSLDNVFQTAIPKYFPCLNTQLDKSVWLFSSHTHTKRFKRLEFIFSDMMKLVDSSTLRCVYLHNF
jgi:hypothetical protein